MILLVVLACVRSSSSCRNFPAVGAWFSFPKLPIPFFLFPAIIGPITSFPSRILFFTAPFPCIALLCVLFREEGRLPYLTFRPLGWAKGGWGFPFLRPLSSKLGFAVRRYCPCSSDIEHRSVSLAAGENFSPSAVVGVPWTSCGR